MKKPFPISIDKELAEWIDSKVIRSSFRNRSHLVEIALVKFKENLQKKKRIEKQDELLKEKIEAYKNKLEEEILKESLSILEKDLDSYKKELEGDVLDKLSSIKAKKEILKRLSKGEK